MRHSQLNGTKHTSNSWSHCNTLQHAATHCITLQHTATYSNTLTRSYEPQSTKWNKAHEQLFKSHLQKSVRRSEATGVLQGVAGCCRVLQGVAVYCRVLQCIPIWWVVFDAHIQDVNSNSCHPNRNELCYTYGNDLCHTYGNVSCYTYGNEPCWTTENEWHDSCQTNGNELCHCSVLQCAAVQIAPLKVSAPLQGYRSCCSLFQNAAVYCSVLQCKSHLQKSVCRSEATDELQCFAVCCAECCSVPHSVAVYCSV